MAIDNDAQSRALNGLVEEVELVLEAVPPIDKLGVHWRLGSRDGVRLKTDQLETKLPLNDNFCDFDDCLRSFISHNFLSEALRYEDVIYACTFLFIPFRS